MFAIDMLLFIPTQLTWKLSSKTISWYVVNEILLHNHLPLSISFLYCAMDNSVFFYSNSLLDLKRIKTC